MNWFSWLTKTGLEPSLVYEYGLAFAHNELEEEDIVYFNHEFLQSMGISIAKHRLEILKLARKEKKWKSPPAAVTRLIVAIKRTKRCLANYIRTFSHCEESALVVVPTKRASYGTRWKSAMVKRKKRLMISKQERLFLTNGTPATIVPALPGLEGFSSPVLYSDQKEEKVDEDGDEEEDGYWSAAMEDIRWDTLFTDLKPN
ncbi:hypothetical protein K1719_018819 [Acacia pycnantha]|nr:hypothetical protein K1719_018819 [Acacia pycnantha]